MADPNPIGGWILPNHLDHSLLLYDPAGHLLGTYRLLPPLRAHRPMGATIRRHPHHLGPGRGTRPPVAGLIRSPNLAPQANFTAFLDATLWACGPAPPDMPDVPDSAAGYPRRRGGFGGGAGRAHDIGRSGAAASAVADPGSSPAGGLAIVSRIP